MNTSCEAIGKNLVQFLDTEFCSFSQRFPVRVKQGERHEYPIIGELYRKMRFTGVAEDSGEECVPLGTRCFELAH